MNRIYAICDFETTGLFDLCKPDPYPIEVGIVFTDENFITIRTYENMICWTELQREIENFNNRGFDRDKYVWPHEYKQAYSIHGITPKEYLLNSIHVTKIAEEISDICKMLKEDKYWPILFSDNIQFEYRLMWKIFNNSYGYKDIYCFPFHYCGWDSSEFLVRSGVGDPKPYHRALKDASILQQHMIRAVERLTKFQER